ncbi:sensory transduction protein LytR [Peptococcaceae bacterium CEB3]|nr:sensory transduction protein LytR [Peptococcaceae bacterium CEB3]
MKVVLVDDEVPARAELHYLLEQFPEISIIGECRSGGEALEQVPLLQPDILFMDVHLRDMDGLDVVQNLQRLGVNSFVVFATAFDVHAVRAFELNAVDYILKPFSLERLTMTIDRIKKRCRNNESELAETIAQLMAQAGLRQRPRRIPATVKGRVTLIDPQDLLYVMADGRYACLVTKVKTWATTYSLQEIEERLDPAQFIRTHRAYLVNLDRVKEVIPWFNGTYKIVIDYPEVQEVPVSRTYVKALKERLEF